MTRPPGAVQTGISIDRLEVQARLAFWAMPPRMALHSIEGASRMAQFATKLLPVAADAVAPDGSQVCVLLALAGGSMAHFELRPGQVSRAVVHRTVEEIWYVLAGRGEMWRADEAREEVVPLVPGTCITIPVGTRFQFRSTGQAPLEAVGVTMPPWPGEGEAVPVAGPWAATE
jgi:mannose-6-phosphate isomerase-like protein (cupin superfamily)